MANHEDARGDGRGNAVEDLPRSEAWQAADEARSRANDLRRQADEAHAEADALEAKATAEFEGVEAEATDPLAGTWEGAVAPEVAEA